ncbi:MAG: nicotinate-nucleotide adenylyltransferase [Bacteroidales bacterium]|jgi:nicotinate-nucleotide adenylyltransferase|nr:nicotinate-nucleotide adenylyltransferase [Bacteroidales bacterium]
MRRTALFFGSFNPIHVGHLIIANCMLQQEDVDEVWFVVSPQNPLKERATLLADHHRMQMVLRAIDDNYRLRACDIEMKLPVPSYTVVTLAALGEKYPEREFCLIMGSDNLESFERWRNYEYILEHYRLLVYPRPGSEHCQLTTHPSVTMVDVPTMNISSSYIRKQIAEGKDVRYLLTEPVYKYLTEMHFYEKVG